jgi:hypothetical protein
MAFICENNIVSLFDSKVSSLGFTARLELLVCIWEAYLRKLADLKNFIRITCALAVKIPLVCVCV